MKIRGNITKDDLTDFLSKSAEEILQDSRVHRGIAILLWCTSGLGAFVVLLYLLLMIPGVSGEGLLEGLLPFGLAGLFLVLFPFLLKILMKYVQRYTIRVVLRYLPEGESCLEFEFADNFIRCNEGEIVTEVPRDKIVRIQESSHGFLILLVNGRRAFLPHRFFNNQEEREAVRTYLD